MKIFGADSELVDEFGKIERESERLLGLFAQFVDENDPVAAQEARFRRRLHSKDAALRAGDIHQHPAGTLVTRRGLSHMFDHLRPGLRIVMGAIDARAIHASGHQSVDQFGFRRRFGRQRRHHAGSRAAVLPFAEQPVGLRLQFRRARHRQSRRRIGRARFARQPLERRNERIERQRYMAFAAAERREAPRREPVLQIGQVMRAQRDIPGEIQDLGRDFRLVRADAPTAPMLGASALHVLTERFHLGEKCAEFLQVASEFSSHGVASQERVVDEHQEFPRQAGLDVEL